MRVNNQIASLILFAVLVLPAPVGAESSLVSDAQSKALWEQYKSAFVQEDGRVIDRGQKDYSHSESQGYGMLLSVQMDDKAMFNKAWEWTRNNLRSKKGYLLSWAWGKKPDGQWGILDENNATDGDILVAFALLKASVQWNNSSYKDESLKMIDSIKKFLSVEWNNRTFLLPGYIGFRKEKEGLITLNPSYVIFPAYRAFAEVDDKAFWTKAYDDGLFLLEKSRFGKFRLPADWVTLNKTDISLPKDKDPLFGFDAIRTLLHLSWEDNPRFPDTVSEIFKIYDKLGFIPVTVDLFKENISLVDAPAGFYAIYARVAAKSNNKALSAQLIGEALKKNNAEKNDYFSKSLLLLALKGVN